MYYCMDAILVVVVAITCFIDVKIEKSSESDWKALKKFMQPVFLIFFGLNLILGTTFGVADTYVAVFLEEEFGASSELIGKTLSTYLICSF